MVVSTNGLGVVPSPPAEPPQVGLLASLSGPYLIDDTGQPLGDKTANGGPTEGPEPEIRWEGAVRYNPEQQCTAAGATDPCAPDMSHIPGNPDLVEAQPAMIWAGDKCSTFGWSARDYKGRATRALLASESKQIAKELWSGTQAQASGWPNRYLASDLANVISNGPMAVRDALSCLEQVLGECSTGARGMIHCTRQMGVELSELGNTFRAVGGLILTYMNTIIVPDAGYDGSGPDGQPAANGSQWAYATLMVTVRRGPIDVLPGSFEEAIIRGTDDLEFRASRPAVATFPLCCHLAVEVNLPLCVGTGVS